VTGTAYRTALVTGASRGIGAAIVEALSARGLEVWAAARSRERLDDLARRLGCRPVCLDVTDPAAVAAALDGQEIDVLVNNAGVIPAVRRFAELGRAEMDAMLDVNLRAVMEVTRRVLPGMIARRRGHLFFIGSTAGHHAYDRLAVYAATKAALEAFARCLRLELLGTGVRVTLLAPGRVETEIYLDAMAGDAERMRDELFRPYRSLRPSDVAAALGAILDLPSHADVSFVELVPTDQAPGGMVLARHGEEEGSGA
jgi:NADP-dependent 3-hydroxy acid dehydrogenase YdfG